MRLLIVEDEADIVHALQRGLKNEGYAVDVAMDGEDALDFLSLNTYDLLVLDINLPKVDGFYILKKLREKDINTRVIIVSANREIEDRIKGLDLGANDYLVKPFHIKELLARVRALTRRPANIQLSSKLEYGDLTFDKDSRTLSTPVNSLLLTSKETELTFVFMQNPETLFSREQLILKIWGSSSEVETGNVDSYISFLRKRLKELKSSCKITTVYGAGYKLEKETC